MIPSPTVCSRFYFLNKTLRHQQLLVRNLLTLRACTSTGLNVQNKNDGSKLSLDDYQKQPLKALYCTKVNIPIVEYAEVKDLPNHPEKLLIDVREPDELKETGKIPTSINIPLGIIGQELDPHTSAKQFQQKYGRPKPDKNTCIILHCRIGKRSQNAAEIAAALGYKNVHNYVGSWLDWEEREGIQK